MRFVPMITVGFVTFCFAYPIMQLMPEFLFGYGRLLLALISLALTVCMFIIWRKEQRETRQ